MAILEKKDYAVLEINKLQSRTTGNMIANAPIASNFTGPNGQEFAENGMVLAYNPRSDKGENNTSPKAKVLFSTNNYGAIGDSTKTTGNVYGLVYATEHMYDPRNKALNSFKIDRGQYPRLYMLAPSDKFTTNAVEFGTTGVQDWTNLEKTIKAGTTVYAVPQTNGYLKLQKELPTAGELIIAVDKLTTMPDGESQGIKFVVLSTTGVGAGA